MNSPSAMLSVYLDILFFPVVWVIAFGLLMWFAKLYNVERLKQLVWRGRITLR